MNQLVYGSQEYGRERTNHGEGQPGKRERERDRSGRVQREGVRREVSGSVIERICRSLR